MGSGMEILMLDEALDLIGVAWGGEAEVLHQVVRVSRQPDESCSGERVLHGVYHHKFRD
jgi:hypothetical protein